MISTLLVLFFLDTKSASADVPKQWLKLLHYEAPVTTTEFYFSPERGKNVQVEYLANVEKLSSLQNLDESHPVCKFPARYLFLRKQGLVPQFDLQICKKYQEFYRQLSSEQVYLIFASQMIRYPSSAFGHLFLRFHKTQGTELLDYAVNYGADVTASNPVSYFVGGMSGAFSAAYSVEPYHQTVRSYSHIESRDLWSYEIKLSPKEIEFLIAHLWEMTHVKIDYYFLSQNCAYHIVSLLEAVTDIRVLQKLPAYTIPAAAIKELVKTGRLQEGRLRPSIRTRLLTETQFLQKQDRESFECLLNLHCAVSSKSSTLQVFNAARIYFDFKYGDQSVGTSPTAIRKFELLKQSAKSIYREPDTPAQYQAPPHESPHESRLDIQYVYDPFVKSTMRVSHRFALFDRWDYRKTHQPLDEFELLKTTVSYSEKKDFIFNDLTLFKVASRPGFTWPLWELSWNIAVSSTLLESFQLKRAPSARWTGLDLGFGLSHYFLDRSLAFWEGVNTTTGDQWSHRDHTFNFNAQAAAGLKWSISRLQWGVQWDHTFLKTTQSVQLRKLESRIGFSLGSRGFIYVGGITHVEDFKNKRLVLGLNWNF